MKALFIILALGAALLTSSCYSNSSKESVATSSEQTAPAPSSSGRY